MTQTLTTEQLRAIAEEELDACTTLDAAKLMARELLANREAQPVLYASEETLAYAKEGEKSLVTWSEPMGDAVIPLYTAPPAPAVPGIDELRLTFERSERESDDGFNLHKYGIGYADEATQARWESWLSCRAAMLAQPVSGGYTLNSPVIPDGWKLVPIDATRAMIDAAQRVEEDGYDAMHKAMLAAAPEGGNGA